MNNGSPTIRRASLVLLVTGFLSISSVSKAAADDDSAQVSKLLSQAKGQALRLSEDTSEMESLSRAPVSWRAHVDAVDRLKVDVNLMGRQVAKLDEVSDTASPWQKSAIERITHLLRELALNTSVVIEDLNEGPSRQNADDYKSYIQANSDDAVRLSSLIAGFVDYGKTKLRLDRLADQLELPPKGN